MIRFGTIGTSCIVDTFIKAAIMVPGFVLTAVYSRTQQRATEFADKYACTTTFTDLEAMAASDIIDAVYIASPTSCHADQGILFMDAGKHVLCEKPVCSTLEEFKAMEQAALRNKVAFMEAMRSLHTPNFQVLKKTLSQVAPVRHFFGTFCQLSSRWPAYLRGEKPNAFLPQLSNGALMDIGCYTVAAAIHLFGPPLSVQYHANMLDTGVDASGTLVMTYADKIATLLISKQSHGFVHSEIQGEGGTLSIDNLGEIRHIALRHKGEEKAIDISVSQTDNNMVYEVAAFLNNIRLSPSARVSQEGGARTWAVTREVMRVLDASRRMAGIVFPADKLPNATL